MRTHEQPADPPPPTKTRTRERVRARVRALGRSVTVDFSNERYVRLYVRDTVTWKRLGWHGQNALTQILRRMDLSGVLDIEGTEPWEALVMFCGAPERDAKAGMELCLKLGCIVHNGSHLVAPRYREANEANKSDRQRQLESRQRRRSRALAPDQPEQPAVNRGKNGPTEPGKPLRSAPVTRKVTKRDAPPQNTAVSAPSPEPQTDHLASSVSPEASTSVTAPASQNVTTRDGLSPNVTRTSQRVTQTSQPVTAGHTESHGVTPTVTVTVTDTGSGSSAGPPEELQKRGGDPSLETTRARAQQQPGRRPADAPVVPPPVNAPPNGRPDPTEALARVWDVQTGQHLDAELFESLVGRLTAAAVARHTSVEVVFGHAAAAFVADCEHRGKRPVLAWLREQLSEWLGHPANGSTKTPEAVEFDEARAAFAAAVKDGASEAELEPLRERVARATRKVVDRDRDQHVS